MKEWIVTCLSLLDSAISLTNVMPPNGTPAAFTSAINPAGTALPIQVAWQRQLEVIPCVQRSPKHGAIPGASHTRTRHGSTIISL